MGRARTIQKTVNLQRLFYDRILDVIFQDDITDGRFYNRTQASIPTDLCIEVTQTCNMTCRNCFSSSKAGEQSPHLPLTQLTQEISALEMNILRVCITGGEPFMHPEIEPILTLPSNFLGCGFVISTNGTLRSDLDKSLISNGWLVAISLHGGKNTHNAYTRSNSYEAAVERIHKLASQTPVHIYSVINDLTTEKDIKWLYQVRDDSGAAFLRFITPRSFGRYEPLTNKAILEFVENMIDPTSGLKTNPSLTYFISANGTRRMSS